MYNKARKTESRPSLSRPDNSSHRPRRTGCIWMLILLGLIIIALAVYLISRIHFSGGNDYDDSDYCDSVRYAQEYGLQEYDSLAFADDPWNYTDSIEVYTDSIEPDDTYYNDSYYNDSSSDRSETSPKQTAPRQKSPATPNQDKRIGVYDSFTDDYQVSFEGSFGKRKFYGGFVGLETQKPYGEMYDNDYNKYILYGSPDCKKWLVLDPDGEPVYIVLFSEWDLYKTDFATGTLLDTDYNDIGTVRLRENPIY